MDSRFENTVDLITVENVDRQYEALDADQVFSVFDNNYEYFNNQRVIYKCQFSLQRLSSLGPTFNVPQPLGNCGIYHFKGTLHLYLPC